MKLKRTVLATIALAFLFVGCANKDEVAEFNKPALYWYKKIGKSISDGNMDKADAYYISLKSEHMRSPLMPTAIMMLAHAHMNKEEYLLANYYLDEYNKRFGEEQSREYTDFMKLKAAFLGVKDVYKDQKLIMDSIANANRYLVRYPGSEYTPLVNTILIRLHMSQYLLNENIAALYERTGKPDAAEIYREKNSDSVVEMTDITPPEKGIIGKIFD
ncbi:outer membrane protein assembly factor BamD [Sulfurovum sp.]|uniref:outer membrane protein assembly factor BamD n=1 Tax=Sulfurovum sp. TaxID=1969726 RepID=UPI0025EF6A27|nr:outer membrane protein assembly factor BamD [Sulfurovum sp.]